MSDDKQTITESSKVENTTRTRGTKFGDYDTHTGLSPDAHIGRVILDPPEFPAEDKERREIEGDSFFANTESFLILDGMKVLTPLMEEDQKKIEDYNKWLAKEGVVYQIRYNHETKIRGVTYHYFGAYIFKKDDVTIYPDAGFIQPDLPKEEGHHACQACHKYIKNKNVESHYATKTHKANLLRREQLEKKPRTERKMVYHQKYDPYLWRELLEEDQFKIFGQPPRLKLPNNIRYRQIESKDGKTDHIIIPQSVYMLHEIIQLFSQSAIFRLA